jgi:hypothetical protein
LGERLIVARKMIATEPFFVFYQKWDEAVPWAEQQLSQAGSSRCALLI